uniref:Putative secreted protein n=1 Tax=Ixodes ricinus TaxID=34613 RepID=A0A6B0UEP7_IXORI
MHWFWEFLALLSGTPCIYIYRVSEVTRLDLKWTVEVDACMWRFGLFVRGVFRGSVFSCGVAKRSSLPVKNGAGRLAGVCGRRRPGPVAGCVGRSY